MTALDIHDPTECDCGRPKFAGNESCSHCRYLDGAVYSDSQIIAALRQVGWLTLTEMGSMVSCLPNALQRPVTRLLESGRVRRQWRENDAREATGRSRNGGRQRMNVGAGGAWEYSLVSRRAA